MASIHQMQMSFVPQQDRLLFRLSTTDHAEFRFWLTRRYVKLLWSGLLQQLEMAQPYQNPDIRATVAATQHQQVIANTDFKTEYQEKEITHFPLGEETILAPRLQFKRTPQGTQILCIHPTEGQGLEIAVDNRLMHSLCNLLSQCLKVTNWDLSYELTTSFPVPKPFQNNP
ncbi:MAG: hypothetical protein RIT27_457 [Pseudomonadota bacterium]